LLIIIFYLLFRFSKYFIKEDDIKTVCGVSKSFFNVLSDMLGSSLNDGKLISKTDKLFLFFMKLKFNLPFQVLVFLIN
jgi:hypothetical protein